MESVTHAILLFLCLEYSEMAENVRKRFKQLVKKHLESDSPTTNRARKRAKTEDESDYEEAVSAEEEESEDEEEEESGDDSDFEVNGPKKKKRREGVEANAMSKAEEYRLAARRMGPGASFPGGHPYTPQQQNAMMAQMYHRQMMMQQRGMYPGHPGMHPEAYRQQMAAAAAAGGGGYPSRFRAPPPSYASHFPVGAYPPMYRPPPHPHGMPPGSQPSANGPHPQVRPCTIYVYMCIQALLYTVTISILDTKC